MATSINHDMDQGANFLFSVTAKNSSGDPINISSGCTASCQMRKHYTSTAYTNLTASITGATGNIDISLGATASSAVKPGVYFYDVELQSNNGATVQRVVQGMITVYPEVTK